MPGPPATLRQTLRPSRPTGSPQPSALQASVRLRGSSADVALLGETAIRDVLKEGAFMHPTTRRTLLLAASMAGIVFIFSFATVKGRALLGAGDADSVVQRGEY